MTNSCSDSEEQRHFKLNECFLVADRIREAGCREQQGISKLSNSKWIPKGAGGDAPSSLKSSNRDNAPAKECPTLSTQGLNELPHATSFPLFGSALFEERSSAKQTSASLATPKESKDLPTHDGEMRGA
jgi:hypothetical protein